MKLSCYLSILPVYNNVHRSTRKVTHECKACRESAHVQKLDSYFTYFVLDSFITTRIRSMGQGNVFTCICHSVHGSRVHPGCTSWLHPPSVCIPSRMRPPWMHPLDAPASGFTPPSSRCIPLPPPEDRCYTGGWYASYWNAYLLIL